ncbi:MULTISPECIES: radical SAM protein [unclassified Imperialibacter]|uniref:SPL family radical SAM protein n=1 Tax=unclassified Imperialibacter TaxID=2629706 RepID=UPI001257A777|nr:MULTISPECIES: radical SAM protein [unclassified Imperialibacter]CAD5274638.1 DNA repair photolyase [Imperialibacter sp. 89]CAD5283161.1 DNA repair photolyase [Imperialibacter sp. 75]VVT22257.1 Radical SAM protein [Imperialibacter sp. EC-SDR9]
MPHFIQAKSILNKTKRRDSWFLDDYTINPYSGCSFNCLFCYIRGSKYGVHMEEKLAVKENAAALLDKALTLRARKGQYGYIVLSSATDPYLQIEKDTRITRVLLEVILKHRFPLHVITRSDLIVRDFDLLDEIKNQAILPSDLTGLAPSGVLITFSFSTTNDAIAHIFEPGATPPSARLNAMARCLSGDFHTGVSLMPLLPYISDTSKHLHEMMGSFQRVGARYVMPASLTLFGNGPSGSKVLVMRAISKHFPDLTEKYRRFFEGKTAMPDYYLDALQKKMKELSRQYALPDSIIDWPQTTPEADSEALS